VKALKGPSPEVGGGGTEQGAGADGGVAGSGRAGAGGAMAGPLVPLDGFPVYSRLLRLTNDQWTHAVTDILRLAGPADLSRAFAAPRPAQTDFDNNEKNLVVDTQAE